MERKTDLVKRRAMYKKRKQEVRQERLMISYVKAKYPVIYKEANEYYSILNSMYPTTNDLRKTLRFKEFLSNTKASDGMVLQIPLMSYNETPNKEAENHEVETPNQEVENHETAYVNDMFPDIDMNTLVQELPPQMMEDLIKDLRADPDLARIMDDVEIQMEEVDDLDINIDIDDRLENELLTW